jgi:hypothetical protein
MRAFVSPESLQTLSSTVSFIGSVSDTLLRILPEPFFEMLDDRTEDVKFENPRELFDFAGERVQDPEDESLVLDRICDLKLPANPPVYG